MTIPSGVNKSLIYGPELVAWGTKALANSGKKLRRVTAELNLTRASFTSAEITDTAQTSDMRLGTHAVEGTLSAELSTGSYTDLIAAALRGTWTTGSTTGAVITIAADATTDKFVRSAGSFITNGFKAGDLINVSGFVNSANNGRFIVKTVTATELFIDGALTTEAEGASVTILVPGKKLTVPTTGRTNQSFTFEQFYEGINVSEVADGVKINSVGFDIGPDAMATVEFGLMGRTMDTSGTQYFTSPTAVSTNSVLSGSRGTLYLDNTAVAVVTGLTIDMTGNMETGSVVGSAFTADIFLGRVGVTGELTAYFQDNSFFTKFKDETELSLVFRLQGDGTEELVIKLPRIKLSGANKDDKETGGIITTLPFTALLYKGADTTIDNTTLSLIDSSI